MNTETNTEGSDPPEPAVTTQTNVGPKEPPQTIISTLSPSVRQPSLYPLTFLIACFLWAFGCAFEQALMIFAGCLYFVAGVIVLWKKEEV